MRTYGLHGNRAVTPLRDERELADRASSGCVFFGRAQDATGASQRVRAIHPVSPLPLLGLGVVHSGRVTLPPTAPVPSGGKVTNQ